MGKNKPKIMHITLVVGGGGVEVYTRELINRTCSDYDSVLVCASNYNVELLNTTLCKVYNVDIPREISPKQDILAVREIRKIIKKERPDIIYCHSSMAGAIGRIAAVRMKSKIIYNPHGWSFDINCSKKKKIGYVFIERFLSFFTDKIIVISEYEKRIAMENKICSEKKINVILNGVDIENCKKTRMSRADLAYSDDDFIVACCGRISEQKDPLLFADVAGAISQKCPRAKFIWVGDGELRGEFEEALKRNNVYDKTYLSGNVDVPSELLSVADVAVLFSKWEGFGLVLVEYLALKKPVVATNVGAIGEIITDGRNGRLINSRDANELAEAVLEYENRENIKEIQDISGFDANNFSIDMTIQKSKSQFKELIDGVR